MLEGIATSHGVGIGRAVLLYEDDVSISKRKVESVEAEKERFLKARDAFIAELEAGVETVTRNIGESEAGILYAQIAIMQDPELIKEVLRSIERESVCAEYAFNIICEGYIVLFNNLEDELIRARSADFRDIKNRMLSILTGKKKVDLGRIPSGSILVAEDIPPSRAASIDPHKVHAIVTQGGARFSHISIIARTLRLPAVAGVEGLMAAVKNGDTIVVDGNDGVVWLNPSEEELENHRTRATEAEKRQEALEHYRHLTTITKDGKRIQLCANLSMTNELHHIDGQTVDGIGLFRTEFLFMDHSEPPTEDEQYDVYSRVALSMGDKPVIIRTLDVGGDKEIPYLNIGRERNPYLGFRAVRYCLEEDTVFRTQIAAILRAAVHGDVRVMIPMITSLTELRRVRKLLGEVEAALRSRGVPYREGTPLGIMVETPAAVFCADALAQEADFFSIGTNDLTQYTLAVDRGNEYVAHLYDALHPAVLKAVATTVDAANWAGIPVGVCGEAAADHLAIPLLVGMGVSELSVGAGHILSTRYQVNNLSHAYWQERIPRVLALKTTEEVAQYVRDRLETSYF